MFVVRVPGPRMPMVAVVSAVVHIRRYRGSSHLEGSCIVDEDGWTSCGERACPECGSPAVTVTELVGGLERGSCECGEVWNA